MSQYKPYLKYKDSGIEWIGRVPEHWEVAPVKYHYDARLGKMIQPAAVSDEDIAVPYHRAQTVQWERIVESDIKKMWASPRDIEQFSVSEGDLLICEGGDVCRAAIVKQPPEKNMIFQNSIHRVRSKGEYGVGWVMRLMQHLRSSEWIDVLCNKNTIVHFTSDKLGSLECPLPPPEEQTAIAATLDRETTRIDALIEKKTRFIELLKEKRQALITHAVTKGLNPNVKMKDSGIGWIGQVPEHWESHRLDSVVEIVRGNSSFTKSDLLDAGEYVALQYGRTYKVDEIGCSFNSYVNREFFKDTQIAEFGDTVLISTSETLEDLGHSCFYARHDVGLIGGEQFLLKPRRQTLGKYLYYMTKAFSFHLHRYATGLKVFRFGLDDLKTIYIPNISLAEQTAIAATLDRETARIDTLVEKTKQSITLLKERRAAFITAAVTGQIDLRGEQ